MALSNDLINRFVKSAKDTKKQKKESIMYGTAYVDDVSGSVSVQLDGSSIKTPVSSTSVVVAGDKNNPDRVIVAIKDSKATITGNLSEEGKSPRIGQLNVANANIADLKTANVNVQGALTAQNATIKNLTTETTGIKEAVIQKADIEDLNATNLNVESLRTEKANVTDLRATNANVATLTTKVGSIETLVATKASIEDLNATNANIETLQTEKLDATTAEIEYAKIDFSNISTATIASLYSTSGLIENLTVSNGKVTGRLSGVTIDGDLIEANTLVANRLIIQGEDGLYYRLNTNGVGITGTQTDYNSLNGSVIKAKSIVANQISVTDLQAFGATIGGFKIGTKTINSINKTTVGSTADGIFMDSDGQFAFGNSTNYVKYFLDSDGKRKIRIAADNIVFGAGATDVESTVTNMLNRVSTSEQKLATTESKVSTAEQKIATTETKVSTAEEKISTAEERLTSSEERHEITETETKRLANMISMLVTDGSGTSLMTQTADGWTFSMKDVNDTVAGVAENVDTLQNGLSEAASDVGVLKQSVADIGDIIKYITIGAANNAPFIELAAENSDFRVRITNTSIDFMEGTNVPAYINNNSLYINKAVVENEFQQANYIWKVRANGNMGLTVRR